MMEARCIGLVGGLGVGAAAHYYKELARLSQARNFELDLVMVNADMHRGLAFMEAGDRAGYAAFLAAPIARMQSAGAEIAVIPSVTSHCCLRELTAVSALPILDIYAPLREEAQRQAIRRVALFGTRFVINSNLFGFVPELDCVQPAPDEIAFIHRTYLDIAEKGSGTAEQHRDLIALAHKLIAREKLDAILLAGTDLSLLFNESNTEFPHLDCAKWHIQAVALHAMGRRFDKMNGDSLS